MRRRRAPQLALAGWALLARAVVAAPALLAAAGCTSAPPGPNILVVVLDTVRRDYTDAGPAGGPGFTPVLARLARDGVSYTHAWSVSPWTVPSHASLFTGLLPSAHGCTGRNHRFSPPRATVAEALDESGYETAAFFSNLWLSDSTTGLLRGFSSRFETPVGGMGRLRSSAGDQGGRGTLDRFAHWLAGRDRRKPFFAFVNLLEAHLAYDPPAGYRARHLADLPADDVVSIAWAHEFNAGLHPTESVDWPRVRRLYGGDVHAADHLLGELLGLLHRSGVYEDTVIIVTSDHGENLGEHGLIEHQFSVHETVLAVPLVIRGPVLERHGLALPAPAGGTVATPVLLTDLYDALLRIGGCPPGDAGARPAVLLGARGARPLQDPDRPLVAEYEGPSDGLVDLLQQLNPDLDPSGLLPAYRTLRVRDWRWTIGSDGSRRLHDVARDPLQLEDLSIGRTGIAAHLDSILTLAVGEQRFGTWSGAHGPTTTADSLDAESRLRLRALGYIN